MVATVPYLVDDTFCKVLAIGIYRMAPYSVLVLVLVDNSTEIVLHPRFLSSSSKRKKQMSELTIQTMFCGRVLKGHARSSFPVPSDLQRTKRISATLYMPTLSFLKRPPRPKRGINTIRISESHFLDMQSQFWYLYFVGSSIETSPTAAKHPGPSVDKEQVVVSQFMLVRHPMPDTIDNAYCCRRYHYVGVCNSSIMGMDLETCVSPVLQDIFSRYRHPTMPQNFVCRIEIMGMETVINYDRKISVSKHPKDESETQKSFAQSGGGRVKSCVFADASNAKAET
jgi:hypothetical protein